MKNSSYARVLDRLEAALDKQAHAIANSTNIRIEVLCLEIGKYRQLRAERDYWSAMQKRNEQQDNAAFEDVDEEFEEAEAPPRQVAQPRRRQARPWGS